MQLLGKLLGDPNKRDLKVITPVIDKIEALEPTLQKLSDEELAARTAEFRSQLALHLRGGMVLENELVKLFREALDAVETRAAQCTDEQLHQAVRDYRKRLDHHEDPESVLKDHLQDTLSECFEQAYEKLSPTLNELRIQAAMALGTLMGGWRIVRTMGLRITKLTPMQGFCAETGGAATLFMATWLGVPVSTTHTITGAIVGVGAARRASAVRWNVASTIVYAWVITIPASAIIAALAYWSVSLVR